MNSNKLIKITITALVLIALLIASIGLINKYLTIGQLVITTDSRTNGITLIPADSLSSSKKGFSMQGEGGLSATLKKGGYIISVGNNSSGMSQYVTVKPHAVTHVTLTVPPTVGVEPVTFDSAAYIVADDSRLVYLNTNKNKLDTINNQDQPSSIDVRSYGFKSILWADTTYGVGQGSSGQLYVIDQGSVRPLSSPISKLDDSSAIYAVAPNRQIYIGLGSSVYSGNEKVGFKNIYNKLASGAALLPGLNRVGIVSSGYSSGSKANKASLTVISRSGSKSSVGFSSLVDGWSSWSENDKNVALVGGSSGEVFDASLHLVATIPEGNINNPVWADDNTLYYSVGDQLWSYSVRDQKSQQIANMPLGELVQEMAVSADKSYVYVTTTDSSGNTAVRRVGLRGQKIPDLIFKLQDVLPQTNLDSGYGLGLINFSGVPTIQIFKYPSVQTNAEQLAEQNLQGDGFDLSQLRIVSENTD